MPHIATNKRPPFQINKNNAPLQELDLKIPTPTKVSFANFDEERRIRLLKVIQKKSIDICPRR